MIMFSQGSQNPNCCSGSTMFWSLKHAQDVLREFRKLQFAVYLHNKFPFYQWDLDALKRDLDVHLIIIKLIRCPAHDFHLMATL